MDIASPRLTEWLDGQSLERYHHLSPRLTFQRVPETKRGKVRVHLDVQVDDIDQGRAQIEKLGGRWTGQRYEYPGEGVVIVMTDPEGHEFCLVQYQ
jgi:predicted enzyme related to lactoylglutathione lyase